MTRIAINKNNALPTFIDRFFQLDPFFNGESWGNLSAELPAVNIQETDQGFVLELAVPGRKKEDFKIELNEQTLRISSEQHKQEAEKSEDGRFTRREFGYQAFSRSFQLPQSIDSQAIEARYEAGILRIQLHKKEEARVKGPRLIDIL